MKHIFLFLALIWFSGCAPESVDKYKTAEDEADVIQMFNEGEYERAVFLLEAKHGKDPADPRTTFLLAQAYLGKAGFEPLAFAGRVATTQSAGGKSTLFPNCDKGVLRSFQQLGLECMMERIYRNAPDADDVNFARARVLFRRAYPNPADTPEWVNTLIGLVELVSSVERHGKTFVLGLSTGNNGLPSGVRVENRAAWIKEQSRLGTQEANYAIQRAQFSGERIARFVKGNREELSLLTTEASSSAP